MSRWSLSLFCISLALGSLAQAQEWSPERRVQPLDGAEVDGEVASALEVQLLRLEQGSSWHYHVAAVSGGAGLELLERAWALAEGPDLNAERDVVLVWAPESGRAAIVLPADVRDSLGLTMWSPLVSIRHVSQVDPVGSLVDLAREIDEQLSQEMERRDREAMKSSEAAREQLGRLSEKQGNVSRRLTQLELRWLELHASGLDVQVEQQRLQRARAGLATALKVRSVFPQRALGALDEALDTATRVEARLNQLEVDQRQAIELYGSTERALEELSDALGAELADESDQVGGARRARQEAAEALVRARRALEAGQPNVARQELESALEGVRFGHELLAQPVQEIVAAEEGPSLVLFLLPWLGGGLGLVVLGGLLIRSSQTRHTVAELDELRGSLVEQAGAFERELLSLRRLHLEASRPGTVALPESLHACNGMGDPSRFTGETAEHLAKSRARLESLHAAWRALRQAVVESDALRAGVGWGSARAVTRALDVLRNVPVRNLPVATVRTAAQELDRLQHGGVACEQALTQAVGALTRLEGNLEDVLQAGQGTQPFEDALAEVQELTQLAAFRAATDPIGATRQAAQACVQADRLDERLQRTLGMARDLEGVHSRLITLAQPPSHALAGEQLPTLVAWAFHLGDEVSQALDEGSRDEALRDLERLNALTCDAEILAKGPVEGPAAELELLREELHQGHLALDELRAEFSPVVWEDVEQSLMRAAGRVELLAEELQRGARIPRAYARLNEIRMATLQATTRLLETRSERERAGVLLQDLANMRAELGAFLEEGLEKPSLALAARADAMQERLEELQLEAKDEDAPPDWGGHLFELQGLAAGLGVLREWAGEECLQLHRSRVLRQSLQRRTRETDEFVRRQGGGIVGAEVRLHSARSSLEQGSEALNEDPRLALAHFELGLRACREAREVIAYRGAVHGAPAEGGLRGDAIQLICQGHRAYGLVHRAYLLGLTAEPKEVRELIGKAGDLLEQDPERSLGSSARAFDLAEEGVLKAKAREREAEDEARERDYDERLRLSIDGFKRARRQRLDEMQRRTRFEILVLGADGDVDIDADDEDESSELEALEVATSEVGELEAEPHHDVGAGFTPALTPEEPEPEAEAESEAEAEPEAEPEAEGEPEAEAEPEAKAESEAEPEGEPEAEAEREAEAESEAVAEAEAEPGTET